MRRRHQFGSHFIYLPAIAAVAFSLFTMSEVQAVTPNPLQSAYWRFEEGPSGSTVPASTAEPTIPDTVLDSINQNHLQAWRTFSAPTYVTTVPPKLLKSGLANDLALEFIDTINGQDLYTQSEMINNGIIAPGGGFTLEAAFNVYDHGIFRTIVGKEIGPTRLGVGGEQNLPTLALKVRGDGDPDAGKLSFEQFDGAGNFKSVTSTAALTLGEWYYAAVVNDGSTLSLYLDSGDENGYVLQAQTAVNGALYQGADPENPSWDHNWTVGRGQYNGNPTDFFLGMIDEVRLTNTALHPSQFLFAPPSAPGDFNGDDIVDGADFLEWQRGFGSQYDETSLAEWKANFGAGGGAIAAVPEPAALALAGIALCGSAAIRRRRR
jgi:hypothetical protein